MAKIKVLTESMVNKIAAGEVIERPASIVKELVENSIDAQAKKICIEIKSGGKQTILVSDDGVGMGGEDASLCILPHATSKMAQPSDLYAVSTLGFRGEALSSIGAVSRMIIETRNDGEDTGTKIVVEGGIKRDALSIGRSSGTTVMVSNMFFNTPARRKFLRHADTEARNVTRVVGQLAAAHPEVGFELVSQGKKVLNFLPATRRERAAELLGIDPEDLVQMKIDEKGMDGEGFLSPPSMCKKTRGKQFIVIRGRPIVSRVLGQAIYRGYAGLLGGDMHPSFLVWLDLDARKIDVNVHPTKREIRIAEERTVEEKLQAAVRLALEIPETPAFVYRPHADFKPVNLGESTPGDERSRGDSAGKEKAVEGALDGVPGKDEDPGLHPPAEQMSFSLLPSGRPRFTHGDRLDGDLADESVDITSASRMWLLHDTYILMSIRQGLLLIDPQGAHKRVLYEEIVKSFETGGSSQQLLFPLTLHLDAAQMEAVDQARELFADLGFIIREFGAGTILVEAVPAEVESWDDGDAFFGILEQFMEEQKTPGRNLKEALAISMAGQSSIRSRQRLSMEEMESLLERLFRTSDPFVCPQGNPVVVKITLGDIEKMFKKR